MSDENRYPVRAYKEPDGTVRLDIGGLGIPRLRGPVLGNLGITAAEGQQIIDRLTETLAKRAPRRGRGQHG